MAADALIRRPRTISDVNAFAELGELVLGTALLAAAAVVVLAAVRGNREWRDRAGGRGGPSGWRSRRVTEDAAALGARPWSSE